MSKLTAISTSTSVGVKGTQYLVLRKDVFGKFDAGEIDKFLSQEFPGLIYRNKMIPGKDEDGKDIMIPDPATARVDGVCVTPQEIVIAVNGTPDSVSIIAKLEAL